MNCNDIIYIIILKWKCIKDINKGNTRFKESEKILKTEKQ